MSPPTRSITSAMRLMMDSSRPASTACASGVGLRMPLGVRDETAERQRIHIAVRDQARALEDEGDLRVFGQVGVELGDDGRGEIQRAGLFIEAAGGFDLAHFLARGDVEAQPRLDQALFFEGGLEQVEPHGFFRQGRVGLALEAFEAGRREAVDGQHASAHGAAALSDSFRRRPDR